MGKAGVGPEVQEWRASLWRTDFTVGTDCMSEEQKPVGNQTLSFLRLVKRIS